MSAPFVTGPIVAPRPFDRPTLGGVNQPAHGTTDPGTASAVIMVPSPVSNTYRVVYTVTLYNPDGGASPIILVQVNDTVAVKVRVVYAEPAMATKTSGGVTWPGGLVLAPGQQLEVKPASAPTTPIDWTAHWGEPVR